MRNTKKITLSASVVALSAVFMVLGALVDVLDLSACALASLLVAFVFVEIGAPYTYLVWLATSLITFICFPGSAIWLEYLLVFGIYPIIKAYIERLPRWSWLILKLVYGALSVGAVVALFAKITGVPFFEGVDALWLKVGVLLFLVVAFILYDIFLTVLLRFYFERLRNRIKHLLK